MGLFGKNDVYDRTRLLRDARDAQRAGKHKRAVALFRRILLVEPQCAEIHGLIAPSLAQTKQHFDAWQSYRAAARALLADKRNEQAVELFRDATKHMPRHFGAWTELAALELRLGKREESLRTLESAVTNFKKRKQQAERIALLHKMVALDPRSGELKLGLAIALSKAGRKHEALHLLTELAKSVEPAALRRIRRCQWEIEPSLAHSWLWFRSAFSR